LRRCKFVCINTIPAKIGYVKDGAKFAFECNLSGLTRYPEALLLSGFMAWLWLCNKKPLLATNRGSVFWIAIEINSR
jgi:hypothetical protein